jgi:hypothetical protein
MNPHPCTSDASSHFSQNIYSILNFPQMSRNFSGNLSVKVSLPGRRVSILLFRNIRFLGRCSRGLN